MTKQQQEYTRRTRIVDMLFPAVAYLRSRSAVFEFEQVDLEIARRLFLERATGTREDGQLSVFFATLEEGQAPSIARLQQLRELMTTGLDEILESPERYGVTVQNDDIEEG